MPEILDINGKPIRPITRAKLSYNASLPNAFLRGFNTASTIQSQPQERAGLQGISRDLYKNQPIYQGIINRLTTLIIGSGIYPQSLSNNREFRQKFPPLFRTWTRNPEIMGGTSWDVICRTMTLSLLLEGEAFYILTKNPQGFPRIQLLPASIIGYGQDDGVLKNKAGEIVGYNVFTGMKGTEPTFKKYGQDVAGLVFIPLEAGQTRGVPMFASALNTFVDIKEIVEYTKQLIKAQTRIQGFVKTQSGEMDPNSSFGVSGGTSFDEIAQASENEIEDFDVLKAKYYKALSYAGPEIWNLQHNDSLELVESNTPSTNIQEFIKQLTAICQETSGIPASVLCGDDKSGSGNRRDIAIQQKRVYEIQSVLTVHLSNIFKFFLKVEIENKNLPDCEDALNHVWQFPSELTQDFGRQQEAEMEYVKQGLMSLTEYCGKWGYTVEDLIDERLKDINTINEKLKGTGLTLQDILPLFSINK